MRKVSGPGLVVGALLAGALGAQAPAPQLVLQRAPNPHVAQAAELTQHAAAQRAKQLGKRPPHAKAARAKAGRGPVANALLGNRVHPLVAGTELELNDTLARPDAFGAMQDMDGAISSSTDQDVYQLVVPADSFVTMFVAPIGMSPIQDPALLVSNAASELVGFNDDDGSTLFPRLVLPLPAGVYYLTVFEISGGTGSYRLTAMSTPATFPAIALNTTTNGTLLANALTAYRLVLPQEGQVTMTFNGGSLDLNMAVLLADGSVYRFVDDSSAGLDPGFDSYLPAGSYMVVVGEYNGTAGSFTLQANFTAGTMPTAPCGTPVTGTVNGEESLEVYRLTLATPQSVVFQTAPSGSPALPDTELRLYDKDLQQIFFQDDDGASLYSRMDVPLPAGTYFVSVTTSPVGSTTNGGFALSGTCNNPVNVLNASFGSNSAMLVTSGSTVLYQITTGTPVPIQLDADTSNGSLSDPQLAVLDSSGALMLANDDSTFSLDSFAGRELPPGTYWILVREYGNSTGTFDMQVRPPLFFADATMKGQLLVNDKAGRVMHAFASAAALPMPMPLPLPFHGNLLIDLNVYLYIGGQTVPSSGVLTWPFTFPNLPYVMQGLSLDAALGQAWMSNLVR